MLSSHSSTSLLQCKILFPQRCCVSLALRKGVVFGHRVKWLKRLSFLASVMWVIEVWQHALLLLECPTVRKQVTIRQHVLYADTQALYWPIQLRRYCPWTPALICLSSLKPLLWDTLS